MSVSLVDFIFPIGLCFDWPKQLVKKLSLSVQVTDQIVFAMDGNLLIINFGFQSLEPIIISVLGGSRMLHLCQKPRNL